MTPLPEQSNVALIRDLFELRDRIQGTRAQLDAAFDAAPEDDLDQALRLDEASRALQGALAPVDAAVDKVAAYEGVQRALAP